MIFLRLYLWSEIANNGSQSCESPLQIRSPPWYIGETLLEPLRGWSTYWPSMWRSKNLAGSECARKALIPLFIETFWIALEITKDLVPKSNTFLRREMIQGLGGELLFGHGLRTLRGGLRTRGQNMASHFDMCGLKDQAAIRWQNWTINLTLKYSYFFEPIPFINCFEKSLESSILLINSKKHMIVSMNHIQLRNSDSNISIF